MTETQARSWAYAAAGAGVIANALFIAFYASFAVQHFAGPRGVAAILGSAADYAGIPQNALLAVITGVVFGFLSRQQRSDQVLRVAGAAVPRVRAPPGARLGAAPRGSPSWRWAGQSWVLSRPCGGRLGQRLCAGP